MSTATVVFSFSKGCGSKVLLGEGTDRSARALYRTQDLVSSVITRLELLEKGSVANVSTSLAQVFLLQGNLVSHQRAEVVPIVNHYPTQNVCFELLADLELGLSVEVVEGEEAEEQDEGGDDGGREHEDQLVRVDLDELLLPRVQVHVHQDYLENLLLLQFAYDDSEDSNFEETTVQVVADFHFKFKQNLKNI